MTTLTLKTFAYAYCVPPREGQLREGSAALLEAGTQVVLVRSGETYSVVRHASLLAPVLNSELVAS